ncbi:MAG: hypothetical protein KC731_09165, partial [Myxococcales bacterium]|nr:hypothetical protein [Myxococcales bacterium]
MTDTMNFRPFRFFLRLLVLGLPLFVGAASGCAVDDEADPGTAPTDVPLVLGCQDPPCDPIFPDPGDDVPDPPPTFPACDFGNHDHAVLAPGALALDFTVCSTHFPAGSTARSAIQAAVNAFNEVQGSAVTIRIVGSEPHTTYDQTRNKNGINKIDVACPKGATDCGYTGRARAFKNLSGDVVECDLVFEPATYDFTDPNTDSENFLPRLTSRREKRLISDAMHEIGHCVLDDHTFSTMETPNIMGINNGAYLFEGPSDDGSKCLNCPVADGLKACDHQHMRLHYPDGSMGVPELFFTNYDIIQRSSGSFAPTLHQGTGDFFVRPGDTQTLRWSVMNTGPNGAPLGQLHVYLTTDRHLGDSNDVLVLDVARPEWVGGGKFGTLEATFTVPGLPLGRSYWIALVADATNATTELDETNNVHFHHRKLTTTDADLEASGIALDVFETSGKLQFLEHVDFVVTNLGSKSTLP